MSLYQLASSLLWAITPEYFDLIMAVAESVSTPAQLAELALRAKQEKDWASTLAFLHLSPELQGVALQAGQRARETRKVEMRGDVAVIPIEGAIFRRANLFSELSGNATSVQMLALDFFKTTRELNAKGVVFNVDSPGGEVNGIGEMAGHIFAAREFDIPMWTYTGGMFCSAALWLGLASQKTYAHPTSRSGSIGVMARYTAGGRNNEKIIVSSQSPNKNLDPNTAKGEVALQTEVDKAAAMFIADVARFRGVTAETVEKKFGGGGTMFGEDAKEAGLIDATSTFEDVIAEMQDVINTKARTSVDFGAVTDDQALAAVQRAAASLLANEQAARKETEEMALNETLQKLLAGLSAEERAELLGQQATTTTQQPPAPPAPPAQPPAAPAHTAAAQPAALAPEVQAILDRAITAECNQFLGEVSRKITPAEKAGVAEMYKTLAKLSDGGTALATYKASIVARPDNPMLRETVAATGALTVLQNDGTTAANANAEDEAQVVARCLNMTQPGREALAALKAGDIQPSAAA